MNLQQAFDMFIMSREEFCQDTTINGYKSVLGYFISFMEEQRHMSADEIDINSIDKTDLSAYTVYLRDKPKYENHPFSPTQSKGLSKRSIKTYQTDVRAFFNYLYDEEYIENNVVRKYKIITPERKQIIPLTVEDVAKLDKVYNNKTELGLRNMCLIHLMLDAGLRRNEVINLEISHVVFSHKYIRIVNGKGNKDRIIPLAPRLKKILYTYLTVYRPYCDHNYFLCNGTDREQLTEDCINSLFNRMKKHLTLSRFYPHLLRHTFATAYIMQGGDLESLRIYMGHSDIATTQKYLHLANQFGLINYNIYKLDKKFFIRQNM